MKKIIALSARQADLIFVVLLAASIASQVFFFTSSSFSLAPDEAHYWEWAKRLDLSYYSKGPIVALLIRLGTELFGDTVLGVRFGAALCYGLFSVAIYTFLRMLYSPGLSLLCWLLIRAVLIFSAMGLFMTTDAPVALFWALALIAATKAIKGDEFCFIFFGLFSGLAVLTKYTSGLLFVGVAAFLLLTPAFRKKLISMPFLLGAFTFLATLSPIIIWNAEHHWVNFAHNAGHLAAKSGFGIKPKYFFDLLGSQLGLVGPVLFPLLLVALYKGYELWRKGDNIAGLYFFSSAPLALLCLLLSFTKRIYANWPMPLYIGALFLLCHLLFHKKGGERFVRFVVPALLTSLLLTLLAHGPLLNVTYGLPSKMLTTKKLVGWSALGYAVQNILEEQRDVSFVVASDYEVLSEIAFYTKTNLPLLCDNLDGRRMNQYDLWGGWEEQKGKNALIVLEEGVDDMQLRAKFKELTVLEEKRLEVYYVGEKLRAFRFMLGKHFDGSVPEEPVAK